MVVPLVYVTKIVLRVYIAAFALPATLNHSSDYINFDAVGVKY